MDTHQKATLPVLWRRWTAVVALFASRDPGRLRLDPAEYEALHHALVEACQAQAENADPQRAARLGNLKQLVQPWITAGSLAHADRELLKDVLARSRVIDKEMAGRDWLAPPRRHRWLAALVLACLVVPPLLVTIAHWDELGLADTFDSVWRWLRQVVRETGGLGFWFTGTGVLTLAFAFWTFWTLTGPRR